MSVLIKGYEMPKDGCKDCVMVKRGQVFDICPFLRQEVNGNVERGGKPNGCPLIDLPDTDVGDTISRQAAIDAIEAYFGDLPIMGHYDMVQLIKKLPSAQPEITDTDVQEYCRKRDLVVITYDLFHEMQRRWSKTAQPEPRWIPVEERLPEVGKRVLVTIPLVNGYPWVGIAWHGTPIYEDKVCFYVADSEWGDYEIREVTAWMPLPKPYERREDE